nr:hypothetical protein [Sedimentibacter sp.]
MLKIIISILLFAIAFVFVCSWGYVKEQRKSKELFDQLMKKAQEKVLKEMKERKILTKEDIEKVVDGTKSSLFWSKSKMTVVNSKDFAYKLIKNMQSDGLLEQIFDKNVSKYKIL